MKLNNLFLVAGGIIGYCIYQAQLAGNTVKQLSFMIFGIKYDKSNSNIIQSQLIITLRIHNPTFNTVSFNSFQGSIFLLGTNVAKVFYSPGRPITINSGPNSNTDITFPVVVFHSNATVIKDAILQWAKGNFNQTIRIVGVLNIAGTKIPFDKTTKLNEIGSAGDLNYSLTY